MLCSTTKTIEVDFSKLEYVFELVTVGFNPTLNCITNPQISLLGAYFFTFHGGSFEGGLKKFSWLLVIFQLKCFY